MLLPRQLKSWKNKKQNNSQDIDYQKTKQNKTNQSKQNKNNDLKETGNKCGNT